MCAHGVWLALSSAVQAAAPSASVSPAPVTPVGEAVYAHWCAPCHAAGPGHPGTESLHCYGGQRPAVLLERTDLSAAAVATLGVKGAADGAVSQDQMLDAELELQRPSRRQFRQGS
jgi:hypothetical protein